MQSEWSEVMWCVGEFTGVNQNEVNYMVKVPKYDKTSIYFNLLWFCDFDEEFDQNVNKKNAFYVHTYGLETKSDIKCSDFQVFSSYTLWMKIK